MQIICQLESVRISLIYGPWPTQVAVCTFRFVLVSMFMLSMLTLSRWYLADACGSANQCVDT